MTLVFWALFSVGVGVGLGFGWSAGYVRGLHVGHARGQTEAAEFSPRWRAQLKAAGYRDTY
jgi:hypothetical protein